MHERYKVNMFRPLRSLYATDSVERVKQELAASEALQIDLLIELAFDGSEDVRLKVAENSRAPVGLLLCMAQDGSRAVREACAANLAQRSATRAILTSF
jgi:hypothetical protein